MASVKDDIGKQAFSLFHEPPLKVFFEDHDINVLIQLLQLDTLTEHSKNQITRLSGELRQAVEDEVLPILNPRVHVFLYTKTHALLALFQEIIALSQRQEPNFPLKEHLQLKANEVRKLFESIQSGGHSDSHGDRFETEITKTSFRDFVRRPATLSWFWQGLLLALVVCLSGYGLIGMTKRYVRDPVKEELPQRDALTNPGPQHDDTETIKGMLEVKGDIDELKGQLFEHEDALNKLKRDMGSLLIFKSEKLKRPFIAEHYRGTIGLISDDMKGSTIRGMKYDPSKLCISLNLEFEWRIERTKMDSLLRNKIVIVNPSPENSECIPVTVIDFFESDDPKRIALVSSSVFRKLGVSKPKVLGILKGVEIILSVPDSESE